MKITASTVFLPIILLMALLASAIQPHQASPAIPRCPAGTQQLADGSHVLPGDGTLPGNADACLFPVKGGWVVINH